MSKGPKRENHESCIIRTWSGKEIDVMHPDPEAILIDDIAASLARQNRFGGHIQRESYTVAEHCLLGLPFCEPLHRFEFLMHDASEYVLGDVKGPIKRLLGMQFYRELELIWTGMIALRFGLHVPAPPREIHEVDQRMLMTEQRDLLGRMPLSTDKFPPFPMRIPSEAPSATLLQRDFIDAFDCLVKKTPGAKR